MNDRKTAAIRELLKKSRNPFDIAQELSVKASWVRTVMGEEQLGPLPGWGRPELQPHIVSRRASTAPEWPAADQARLIEVRRLHDQGRVTMCQGQDAGWVIQYAVPTRGQPLRRQAYFYGG